MRVAFVNPQGNFDPRNSYLASHPDFGASSSTSARSPACSGRWATRQTS